MHKSRNRLIDDLMQHPGVPCQLAFFQANYHDRLSKSLKNAGGNPSYEREAFHLA